MEIVRAREEQVPQMVECWKELADFHAELDPFYRRPEEAHERFARYAVDSVKSDEALALVAVEGGKVVGYSISVVARHPPVVLVETHVSVNDMLVMPGERGCGVGGAMAREIIEWARGRGIRRIELQAASGNGGALAFWAGQGFEEYARVLYLDL